MSDQTNAVEGDIYTINHFVNIFLNILSFFNYLFRSHIQLDMNIRKNNEMHNSENLYERVN